MAIEDEIFKKAHPDFKKLKTYGFIQTKEAFMLEKSFMKGDFRAVINVSAEGKVSSAVYDSENGEEYLPLRMEHTAGGYSSEVKAEYEKLLREILISCFLKDYFISRQANRVCNLIYKKFNAAPDFPWKEQKAASDAAVFRKPSGKWFALIMNIKKDRIISGVRGNVDIMNLKLDKNEIQMLFECGALGVYPAYHMNKQAWITVVLDETLSDEEVMGYIQRSHENVK